MIITPENATSWRDLADQLRPEQIAELEADACSGSPLWDEAALLSRARELATENMLAALMGDVPIPAGGAVVGSWEDDEPLPSRIVSTPAKSVDATKAVVVSATATQLSDGSIRVDTAGYDVPQVCVDELNEHGLSCERLTISADGARSLARALIEAAAAVDGWTR